MGRLIYIIISILLLNVFAVFDYDTQNAQLDCSKKTHSYYNDDKITQTIDIELEDDFLFVNFEFDFNQPVKTFLFERIDTAHIAPSINKFILFEADASPPLYT